MKEDSNKELQGVTPQPEERTGYPGALALDVETYLPCVEKFDITEAQKVELLQTLRNIMSAFVDLGWDVDSVPDLIPAWREISGYSGKTNVQINGDDCSTEFNGAAVDSVSGKDDNT